MGKKQPTEIHKMFTDFQNFNFTDSLQNKLQFVN